MREIKFRLWNCIKDVPELSKMFYDVDNVMECLKQQMLYDEGLVGFDHVGCGSVFMQYTGLKDKNGKEIWEGDVVGWITPSGFVIDKEYGEMQVVTFFEGGFSPFCVKGWEVNPDPGEIEVLGNIYENNFEL